MNSNRLLLLTAKRIHPKLQDLLDSALLSKNLEFNKVFYEEGESVISAKLEQSSAVFCAPGRWLSTSVIKKNSHIKLYQLWSSGFDKFNFKACIDYNIHFNTNDGNNSQSVAEHTLLLMLGASKKLPEMHMRTIEGKWTGNCNGSDMYLLSGKILFIIGLGNIGKKVMKIALAIGMKVIYYDKIKNYSAEVCGAEYVDLEHGLATADYISLHIHLNDETKGIINKNNIHLVRKSCFLINVSRAELIDRTALEFVVSNNLLRGLAFDVYYSEPTNGSEDFLNYKNSVFTPHIAGSTKEAIIDCIQYCVDNLHRALLGQSFDSRN
jgi:phosphoglycerate dehydrogenase-like enzyme